MCTGSDCRSSTTIIGLHITHHPTGWPTPVKGWSNPLDDPDSLIATNNTPYGQDNSVEDKNLLPSHIPRLHPESYNQDSLSRGNVSANPTHALVTLYMPTYYTRQKIKADNKKTNYLVAEGNGIVRTDILESLIWWKIWSSS